MSEKLNQNIIPTNLGEYAKRSYLAYAMSVVKGRSIPDVEDGLKPVHRRILYAMHQLKLWHSNPSPTKSARVVGDVLGKYHPHGDSSVYDAMVRMSQKFSLRYPLVHGEGNWGTRDGDSAAAMRYTEAKLTPIANALLNELSWDTVDYQPNYDGKDEEPSLLPARLPFLLLNGSSGIGVGMATEFPSHQINEVLDAVKFLIKKPDAKFNELLEIVKSSDYNAGNQIFSSNEKAQAVFIDTFNELMSIIKGPDYPTGSQIITSPDEIKKIYFTGKGSIRLRARWRVEKRPNNKDWDLVFYEIPQNTSIAKISTQLDDIFNPKQPKDKNGKKIAFKAEQLRLKKIFGDLIDEYKDLSDNEMRFTVSPKNRKQDPEQLALLLCAHTDIESNMPTNFVSVDYNGNPKQDNILSWLMQWTEFRINITRRKFIDQLNRTLKRLHILHGRLAILDQIHKVVDMIIKSDNPKLELMEDYGLDEIQADDVLDMRLRSLAKMEKDSLIKEKLKLDKEKERLEKILGDEKLLKKEVIKELDEDLKLYGDERRTLIAESEASSAKSMTFDLVQEQVSNEYISVALTDRGWISWNSMKSEFTPQESDFKLKSGDSIRRIFYGTRADTLLLLDQKGQGYSINLVDLPGRNDSNALTSWIEPSSKIVEGAIGNQEQYFLLAGEKGSGFITQASNWMSRLKAGKSMLSLKDDESPISPILVDINPEKNYKLVTLSSENKIVCLPLKDVKVMSKGKGVALMGLGKDANLLDVAIVNEDGNVILKNEEEETTLTEKDLKKVFGARSSSHKGKVLTNKNKIWTGFNKALPVKSKETEEDEKQ